MPWCRDTPTRRTARAPLPAPRRRSARAGRACGSRRAGRRPPPGRCPGSRPSSAPSAPARSRGSGSHASLPPPATPPWLRHRPWSATPLALLAHGAVAEVADLDGRERRRAARRAQDSAGSPSSSRARRGSGSERAGSRRRAGTPGGRRPRGRVPPRRRARCRSRRPGLALQKTLMSITNAGSSNVTTARARSVAAVSSTRATGTPAGGPAAGATTGGRGSSQRRVLALSLKRCVAGARVPNAKLSKSSTCVRVVRLPEQHGYAGSSASSPSSVGRIPGQERERRVGVDEQPARIDRVVDDHVGVPAEPDGRAERDRRVRVGEQVAEAAELAVGRREQVGPDAGVGAEARPPADPDLRQRVGRAELVLRRGRRRLAAGAGRGAGHDRGLVPQRDREVERDRRVDADRVEGVPDRVRERRVADRPEVCDRVHRAGRAERRRRERRLGRRPGLERARRLQRRRQRRHRLRAAASRGRARRGR